MHERPHMLVTCEHGGNRVPAPYRSIFQGKERMLESHRGYDPGSLELARSLSSALGADLVCSTVTRLLVDLNRSSHHPGLFSELTRPLPADDRTRIFRQYYEPYRNEVSHIARKKTSRHRTVLHISVHSFAPVRNGKARDADIGFLYDPSRVLEKEFCSLWKKTLVHAMPELRVRMNYPYRGVSDGLATGLRAVHDGSSYLGIELEVNHGLLTEMKRWRNVKKHVISSLMQTLASSGERASGGTK